MTETTDEHRHVATRCPRCKGPVVTAAEGNVTPLVLCARCQFNEQAKAIVEKDPADLTEEERTMFVWNWCHFCNGLVEADDVSDGNVVTCDGCQRDYMVSSFEDGSFGMAECIDSADVDYEYEGGDCWDENGTSILFEITVGFLTASDELEHGKFWVCEVSEWKALEMLMSDDGSCSELSDLDTIRSIAVQPCTRERARAMRVSFVDDNGNEEKVPLCAEHDRKAEPRVIASTFWSL